MKIKAILLVFIALLIGVCEASAKTKFEREAEKRKKFAEKVIRVNAEYAQKQVQWKRDLSLSCPLGGENLVEISYKMGSDISHMKYGGYKQIFVRSLGVIRVKNPYTNLTLDISEDTGYVVKNLCPGGSITLVKSMDPNLFRYSQYERYHWIAEGIIDGRMAYGHIGAMTLDAWQGLYERQRKETPWLINLDRVDKEF